MIWRVAHLVFFAAFLAEPFISSAAALNVNGVCELGSCNSPDVLRPGATLAATSFDFTYTFSNTDSYRLFGNISASNSTAGNSISFGQNLTAVYLGNATGTASQTDTLTTDLLQNYLVSFTSGTFYENANVYFSGPVSAASSATAQLSLGGQDLPLMGPFTPAGPSSESFANVFLSGFTNPVLNDFRYIYTFNGGSMAGAAIGSMVPEPSSFLLLTAGLGGIAISIFGSRLAKCIFKQS